jgi:4-amino-4-deoxy-L-arabinose transferase-like glycosyltransferase
VTILLEAPRRPGGAAANDGRSPAPIRLRRRIHPLVPIAVLALVLRLVEITRSYELFVDEITYATISRNVARGDGLSLYGQPFTLHPSALFGLNAVIIDLFGIHGSVDQLVMDLRPVSAVFGTLSCIGVYLLVERAAGRTAAIVAALLLALDPFAISYDSQVMLEACCGAAAVGAFGLVARLARVDEARRTDWMTVMPGFAVGIVVTTKETFGLVVVVTLLILWATGWVLRRRETLMIVGIGIDCYVAYLIALAGSGDLGHWWSANVDGLLRLVGARQETGFNAPSVHVSLLSRAFADLSQTASSYLLLAVGPLAAVAILWSLKPWRADWRTGALPQQRAGVVVAVWTLVAAAYLSYATVFGSIEEQMYYILLPSAVCSIAVALGTVGLRRPSWRTVVNVALIAVLAYSSAVWVKVHTTPSDGYTRFLAWESTHIPPGATMSVTEGSAQFLLDDLVLGQWDTRAALVAHHVDYVLVSVRLVDQGYSASLPFLHLLEQRGTLLFSSGGGIGLRVYDVRAVTGAATPTAAG